MKTYHLSFLLPLCMACFCPSCKENPKLVEERAKQKVEIARLKGDLAIIEEKLKNLPPDQSADLEKARKSAEEQTAEVAKLEAELSGLSARKRALQSEFDTYRAKHALK